MRYFFFFIPGDYLISGAEQPLEDHRKGLLGTVAMFA